MAKLKNHPASPLLPEQFFDFYDAAGAKEMLWKWFTATVTDGYGACTPMEKENIVTLYERLSCLLDGIKPKSTNQHEK
ncbi:MAG: hypothetical protein V4721_02650 [Bacteroidota bacterium]